MTYRQLACSLFVIAALAPPAAAQSSTPRYGIPCLTRADFVRRLREQVREPDRVEVALTTFSIAAERDPQRAPTLEPRWSVVVRHTGDPEPRTLRDASCEAVSAAAVVMVAAWIDEVAPPAAPSERPAASAPPPSDEAASGEGPSKGLSLVVNEVRGLGPSWAPGVTLELWHFSEGFFLSVGASFWPAFLGLASSPHNDRYARPTGELYLSTSVLFFQYAQFRAGPWLAGHIGLRPLAGGKYDATLRVSAAVQLQCDIGAWMLFGRFGLSYVDAAVDISTVAALGVGVGFF